MAYIYEPAGKAKEYGDLALNMYTGCSHGCLYCYVPRACKVNPEAFHIPKVREINERALDREIEKLRSNGSNGINPPQVFLCFTCDSYQHLDQEHRITRTIIQRLNRAGIGVRILTKAGLRSTMDFDLLSTSTRNEYGATLTFVTHWQSKDWEPGAADPGDRIEALDKAHSLGIPTWASLEPVIDPEQSLELIRLSAPYVDMYKVGKWNHDTRANAIDWPAFAAAAVELLKSLGKNYYIKKDLAAYLPEKEVIKQAVQVV